MPSRHPAPQHHDTEEVSALDRYYNRKPIYRRLLERVGLQTKMVVALVTMIVLTLGGFLLLSVREARERMAGDLSGQARQMSLSLSALGAKAFQHGTEGKLQAVVSELVRSRNNVTEIVFYDTKGAIVAGISGGAEPMAAFDPHNTSTLGQIIRLNDPLGDRICITAPIYTGDQKTITGFVRVGISMTQYAQQTYAFARTALKLGAGLVLLAIPVSWLLVRRIFLPIRLLVHATRHIAGGDLDTRVETGRPDVIGELARAFNEMVRTVKQQQEATRNANQQLAEANRDLETKVEQRTVQFEAANKRLSAEIAEKEDFLRAVSHDLNAPLRNISGMVTMLLMKKKDTLDEDTKHRLDRIKKNVEVETDLINELLELSRIKTRRQAMESVELEAMVWDLRGMFENDLKTRDISLIVDTALPTLYCERARVRQVFQNLIDNAIKYMGEGEHKEIHVGCQIRLSEAEFYVRDTGVGIDAEDISKVFFVFRRGKNTTLQNVTGKGVGLASVKSIVETYSGKIWVESELGRGSTFRFTFNGQYVPAAGGGARATKSAEIGQAA